MRAISHKARPPMKMKREGRISWEHARFHSESPPLSLPRSVGTFDRRTICGLGYSGVHLASPSHTRHHNKKGGGSIFDPATQNMCEIGGNSVCMRVHPVCRATDGLSNPKSDARPTGFFSSIEEDGGGKNRTFKGVHGRLRT